jgi:hypothetical protein
VEAPNIITFFERLEHFRLRGEDDPTFYKRLGVSKELWSRWKTHKDPKPDTDTIRAVADSLRLSIDARDWLTYGGRHPPRDVPQCGGGEAAPVGILG